MGTWNTKIDANDSFFDIYQHFLQLYDQGIDPAEVSVQIQDEFAEMFNAPDEKNNCLFGLAMAQWEVKALDPAVLLQVRAIIESGDDLEVWKGLGADDRTVERRKTALDEFLRKISAEKDKPKRRSLPKFEHSYNELVHIISPDGRKTFSVSEQFTDGVYVRTGSMLLWNDGGGSIFYYNGQGKYLSARWRDSQTLEVTHDKDICFEQRHETFYFLGDDGVVVYIPTTMRPVRD